MARAVYSHGVDLGAAAVAAALAVGLVTVPPERYESVIARTEIAAVQLHAAVTTQLAAVANAAPEHVVEQTVFAAGVLPVNAASASAAAENVLTTLGRTVLKALGVLVAPLWWLGFPITYPLYLQVQRLMHPQVANIGSIFDLMGWFIAPGTIANSVFGPPPAASAAADAEPAEADTAGVAPDGDTLEAAAPAIAAGSAAAVDPVSAGSTAAAAAAATGGDLLTTVGRTIATIAGLALAPFWYLGFPITIPLTLLAVNLAMPPYPDDAMGVGAQVRAIGAIVGWFGLPFALPSFLFPTAEEAAEAPAQARSAAAATDPNMAEPQQTSPAATIEADPETVRPTRRWTTRPAPAQTHPAESATTARQSGAVEATPDATDPGEGATAVDAADAATIEPTSPAPPAKGAAQHRADRGSAGAQGGRSGSD